MAVLQRHQVQVWPFAVESRYQLAPLQPLIDVEQAELLGFTRHLQAHVVDQLQRGGGQVYIGPWPLQQHQVAAVHGPGGTGLGGQQEVRCFTVVQGSGVWDGQPGIVEAPA
ncbi:hypothetical protein D3C80_1405210 [compost metagenome]